MDKTALHDIAADGFQRGRTWAVGEIYRIMRDGPKLPDDIKDEDRPTYIELIAVIKDVVEWNNEGRPYATSEGYQKICAFLEGDDDYYGNDQDF